MFMTLSILDVRKLCILRVIRADVTSFALAMYWSVLEHDSHEIYDRATPFFVLIYRPFSDYFWLNRILARVQNGRCIIRYVDRSSLWMCASKLVWVCTMCCSNYYWASSALEFSLEQYCLTRHQSVYFAWVNLQAYIIVDSFEEFRRYA